MKNEYSVKMIENLAFKQIKAISLAAIRRGI